MGGKSQVKSPSWCLELLLKIWLRGVAMTSEIETGGHSLLDVALSLRNRNGKVIKCRKMLMSTRIKLEEDKADENNFFVSWMLNMVSVRLEADLGYGSQSAAKVCTKELIT